MPNKPPTYRPPGYVPHSKRRQSSYSRGYTRRWERERATYLAMRPLCANCEREGRTALATDLDHIIPHRGNAELFWDFASNVEGLCRSCHAKKTRQGL